MKTPSLSIALMAIAAMLGAFGQYLYKSGADATDATLKSYLINGRLISGVLLYIGVMVLFIAAFKRGGALTTLYPIYASTFIWGAVISYWAYQTPIKPINVMGMLLLVAGMHLMGR